MLPWNKFFPILSYDYISLLSSGSHTKITLFESQTRERRYGLSDVPNIDKLMRSNIEAGDCPVVTSYHDGLLGLTQDGESVALMTCDPNDVAKS